MQRLREVAGLGGLLAIVLLILVEWQRLPETIPTHFSIHGTPDGFGSKSMLWGIAGIAISAYGLLSVAARFRSSFHLPVARDDVRRPHFEELTVEMLGWLKLELAWFMFYVVWVIVRSALMDGPGLSSWAAMAGTTVLLATVGICLWRGVRGV
jgi:uncharacterized membrane protein